MQEVLKGILSTIATTLLFIFGGFDIALQSLLVVIILDYITGISKAYITKELSSEIGFKGILKKLLCLVVVAVATIVDRACGDSGMIRTLIIYYLVANEGLSILENLASMDILVPDILKSKLKQLRGDEEKGEK